MDATKLIITQVWYEKIGRVWHKEDRFNKVGEHITLLNLGKESAEDIEEIFCVRNGRVNVSIKFKDLYYTFFVMNDSQYLDVRFEVISPKVIKVIVPLCWYTLTYSYRLIGKKVKEEDLDKILCPEKYQ